MASIFFPFPLPLNRKQWAYLIVPQCLLAGIIDGGANFGIAYAMYSSQSTVRMWVFKENTIAGDLGVTCLIQTAVSMIITSTLVHTDLHSSAIAPLPFVYPHVSHLPDPATLFNRRLNPDDPSNQEKALSSAMASSGQALDGRKKGLKYYWLMLIRFIFEGSENNILLERAPVRTWLKRLIWTAVQGLGIGIFFGFPLWCLAVLILGPIYGNGNLGNKWAPQVIKLVYALILGVITNPVIAILALGSQAEHHLIPLPSPPIDAPNETSTILTPGSPSMGDRRRRPSFTANTSLLTVPPVTPPRKARSPSSIHGSPFGQQPPTSSPMTLGPTRPRAMTNASETVSLYSLGGMGGRAQRANRPRANSRASVTDSYLGSSGQENVTIEGGQVRLGPPLLTPSGEFEYGQTRATRSGSTSTSGSNIPPQPLLAPGRLSTRERSHSGASSSRAIGSFQSTGMVSPGEGTLSGGLGVGRVMQLQNALELEAPRESLELAPAERDHVELLEDTKE
ncbi:Protein of unknown function DUF2456 [Phaffia rhodozyma]|uniref:Uncharacterized protein n=1 Tax=Phaffia rhodozyma TaxID=264483 RepID=A0A0F7SUP4_PHARH|nr:Protein of unknown function DUF2456 [Phaffia rhodozyma]